MKNNESTALLETKQQAAPIWYQQYVAVKKDLMERYPDADWVDVRRTSYNRMTARVEGADLHVDVFYWMVRGAIDDSWVISSVKKTCNENCLHGRYPQDSPHRILPQSWWG